MSDSTGHYLEKIVRNIKELPEEARKDIEKKLPKYERLIYKMARKYVRNRVEYDDLVQEAMYGFMQACRDFDPSRSPDFHTYAIYRMKGKMYEYCIGNESPIYVPTHVAKASSYVKQMRSLLSKDSSFLESGVAINEVIALLEHPIEKNLTRNTLVALRELKRKLENIANNSKRSYEHLAGLAMESLSLIVSDDVLSKHPEENLMIEDMVSRNEFSRQLKDSLGEKRFTVLTMKTQGWTFNEIAARLEKLGYTNRKGEKVTRQAVKAIFDDTLKMVKKWKLARDIK